MKTTRITSLLSVPLGALVLFMCADGRLDAQTTAFTYQGRLNNNGAAANGRFDFQFCLLDAGTNGNLIAGPVTNAATIVSNGLFTVKLDFGAHAFTGAPRWLQIGVRTNGSTNAFSILKPRQPVAAVPQSILANGASNLVSALPVSQLTRTLSRNDTPADPPRLPVLELLIAEGRWPDEGRAGALPARYRGLLPARRSFSEVGPRFPARQC
jgi:hypothetical protein